MWSARGEMALAHVGALGRATLVVVSGVPTPCWVPRYVGRRRKGISTVETPHRWPYTSRLHDLIAGSSGALRQLRRFLA